MKVQPEEHPFRFRRHTQVGLAMYTVKTHQQRVQETERKLAYAYYKYKSKRDNGLFVSSSHQ